MNEFEKLKKYLIFNVIDTKDSPNSDIYDIPYLEMEELQPEATLNRVGLKLKNVKGFLDEVTVTDGKVINRILSEAIDLIVANTQDRNEFGEILLNDSDDTLTVARRVITKILFLSNIIATNGRRGPATYVILGTKVYELIKYYFIDENDILNECSEDFNIHGLKIYKSNKINEYQIIVGRAKSNDEPCLKLLTSEFHLSGYASSSTEPDDISRKVKYKLEFIPGSMSTVMMNIKIIAPINR